MKVTPVQAREWRLFIQIDRPKSSVSTYKSKYAVSQIQTDVKQDSKVPRFSGAPCSLVKKKPVTSSASLSARLRYVYVFSSIEGGKSLKKG